MWRFFMSGYEWAGEDIQGWMDTDTSAKISKKVNVNKHQISHVRITG